MEAKLRYTAEIEESKPDMVNHPPHYANGTKNFECIEMMEQIFGYEEIAKYSLINAFKYVWRAGSKGKDDLDKAKWYLDKFTNLAKYERSDSKWLSVYTLLKDRIQDLNGGNQK